MRKNKKMSYTIKISKTHNNLLKDLRALKNLPKNEENTNLIKAKKQELLLATKEASTTGTNGELTVVFKAFNGKIRWAQGSSNVNKNVVGVYTHTEGDTYWYPWIISTQLTSTQATSLFNTSFSNLRAHHCEFYESDFISNNDSTNYPEDFDNEDIIFQNLGISNYKGYFDGGDEVYVTPEEILNGQEVAVINSDNNEIVGKISWNRNDPLSYLYIFLILIISFIISYLLYKFTITNVLKKKY